MSEIQAIYIDASRRLFHAGLPQRLWCVKTDEGVEFHAQTDNTSRPSGMIPVAVTRDEAVAFLREALAYLEEE
jgi:hypothetical protein